MPAAALALQLAEPGPLQRHGHPVGDPLQLGRVGAVEPVGRVAAAPSTPVTRPSTRNGTVTSDLAAAPSANTAGTDGANSDSDTPTPAAARTRSSPSSSATSA